MTHSQFSNFHFVYTIIQVVHTEFIKVVLTDYSAFKSLSKMIQEQTIAVIIITLISERRVCVKTWLKRRKMKLCCRMRLEDEYNNNLLLRMTSENFEEIFQLIKDDITKENTKMRELIPTRL